MGGAWVLMVRAAAFVAAAGLLALVVAPVFDMKTHHGDVFVVLALLSIPLGIIPYGIALQRGRTGWRHAIVIGAAVGTLAGTVALFTYAQPIFAGIWVGLFCAGVGVAAALLVWVLIPPECRHATASYQSPRWRDAVPLLLAAAAFIVLPEIDWANRDRSCFNLFRARGSPRSVISVISMRLEVERSQWPNVARTLAAFARTHGWRYRGKTEMDAHWTWFQHEICREPGVVVLLMPASQGAWNNSSVLTASVMLERPALPWSTDVERLAGDLSRHGRLTQVAGADFKSAPAWYRALPLNAEAIPPSAAGSAAH